MSPRELLGTLTACILYYLVGCFTMNRVRAFFRGEILPSDRDLVRMGALWPISLPMLALAWWAAPPKAKS